MIQEQLLLSLQPNEVSTFENFNTSNQTGLIQLLQDFAQGRDDKFIFLTGSKGSGKTHLSHAVSHTMIARGGKAIVLDATTLKTHPPKALRGMETLDFVCIDDVQILLGDKVWEEALFHCYNRIHQSHARLLITADAPPRHLSIQLPDLKSRLMQGTVFHLESLDDVLKPGVLQARAKLRGILLSDAVAEFIIHRVARDMSQLQSILETLDNASMVAQRRITIPFVKQVLKI